MLDHDGEIDEADLGDLLVGHVARLLEHFDSVRIFVTRREAGGGAFLAGSKGGGNFYAQLGQIKEWIIEQDHRARVRIEQVDAESRDDDAS